MSSSPHVNITTRQHHHTSSSRHVNITTTISPSRRHDRSVMLNVESSTQQQFVVHTRRKLGVAPTRTQQAEYNVLYVPGMIYLVYNRTQQQQHTINIYSSSSSGRTDANGYGVCCGVNEPGVGIIQDEDIYIRV